MLYVASVMFNDRFVLSIVYVQYTRQTEKQKMIIKNSNLMMGSFIFGSSKNTKKKFCSAKLQFWKISRFKPNHEKTLETEFIEGFEGSRSRSQK